MKKSPLVKYTIPLKPSTIAWLKRQAKEYRLRGPRAMARWVLEESAEAFK